MRHIFFAAKEIIYFLPTSSKGTIIIPYSIKTIQDYAFHSCQNIEEIFFSEGNLQRIGYESFKNCTRLSRVLLPSTLSSIDQNAFELCHHLQCGCFEIPSNVRALTSIKWETTGLESQLYGEYCLSKGCYVSHIPVTCGDQHINIHLIASIFMTSFGLVK